MHPNQQFQKLSGHRPTPQTVRPLGSVRIFPYNVDLPSYYMQYSDYYKNKTTALVLLMVGYET